MDSIHNHLEPENQVSAEIVIPESPLVSIEIPEKDILVNIELGTNEGVSARDGRYRTFYNMYFVNARWLYHGNNTEKLAAKFPAFVLGKLAPDVIGATFVPDIYGEEFSNWLAENINDYLLMIPIIRCHKKKYKFAGVQLPYRQRSLRGNDGERGEFLGSSHLQVTDICIYGAWAKYPSYSELHYGNAHTKSRLTTKQKQVEDWLLENITGLQAVTTKGAEVAHA